MRDIKLIDSAMKTPGFIESQMVKCGKGGCKCTKGELHGPYFYYRYWKLHHKTWVQKKKYINKEKAEKMEKALEKYRNLIYQIKLDRGGKDQYRAFRRIVKQNIKQGITGMTQRRLANASALFKSFA